MTPTQQKIYKAILTHEKKHGVVPSARQLGKKYNMSHQGMQQHYNALITKGLLAKNDPVSQYRIIHSENALFE